ncbi:MAG: ArnT family glycosyltransferase [Candidatus Brocadiia bacterium]|nr:glycosyltransferase family 39 protein [Planctomycetota bacterium]
MEPDRADKKRDTELVSEIMPEEQNDNQGSILTARYALWVIVALAAGLRLYLVFTAQGINSDAWRYAETARKMASDGLLAGMRGDFLWPYYPLNPHLFFFPFLGSILLHVTGDAVLSLRLVSAAAGVGLVPLGYAIARRLLEKEGIGLMAALFLAVHSEFARASASVYREVLVAFLIAFALYLVLRVIQEEDRKYLSVALAGAILFLAFATRVEAIVAAIGCGLVILFLAGSINWKKRIALCAVMSTVFLALEIPYILWMRKESGLWLVNQWQISREAKAGEFIEKRIENRAGP